MPINKKALTRYLAYDKCLKNHGRKYTWEDLKNRANETLREEGSDGIGKTQFYEDIKFMEGAPWYAPIERYKTGGKTVYYRYRDPKYSISNLPLSETETNQLKSAVQILTRLQGLPQFEWLNEVIPTLESRLGLISLEKQVMSFENNMDYKGIRHIMTIFNAITNKRVLKINYQDFKSPIAYDIDFHPQFLKQYNSRWFVFGHNEFTKKDNWNLALDRINHIEEITNEYISVEMDWDDYFSDFIGVTKIEEEELIEVELFITPEQAPYINTKPIHQTQKSLKPTEGGFITSIRVIPNYELESLILSFGGTVSIISPKSLKDKIKNRLQKALEYA